MPPGRDQQLTNLSSATPESSVVEWVALASPSPRAPLLAKVERLAAPLRQAVAVVASVLCVDAASYAAVYAPRVPDLGYCAVGVDAPQRAAWMLVGQWLTGYALGELDGDATLSDAEAWFLGKAYGRLPALASRCGCMRDLAVQATPEEVFALLPYLLDPLAPGTRRLVLRSDAQLDDRRARKQHGVFYTPADVAEFMVERTWPSRPGASWLDPACGTGVFLRAVLKRGAYPDAVYGCDLEPAAVERCAFVLLATVGWTGVAPSPWARWQAMRMQLATVDALLLARDTECQPLQSHRRLHQLAAARQALLDGAVLPAAPPSLAPTALGALFPRLLDGADVVITNPPYAQLSEHPAATALAQRFVSFADRPPRPTSSVVPLFVEQGLALARPGVGRASLVTPLSIVSSSSPPFRMLRRALAAAPGHLEFCSFDRAPDALFGDDVKTRNTVLTWTAAPGPSQLSTTGLQRWTSRNRGAFLAGVVSVPIRADIESGVPKVDSSVEAQLYEVLRSSRATLVADIVATRLVEARNAKSATDGAEVSIAPTGYNWLGCVRDLAASTRLGHAADGGFTTLRFADATSADAAYATICSRLVYWLWRVEGDGFHVSRGFLQRLPLPLTACGPRQLARLSELGRELWSKVRLSPVISLNRGKRTVAFPAAGHTKLLDAIDTLLLQTHAAGMTDGELNLRVWYERMVVVDFSEERRVSIVKRRDAEQCCG